MSWIYYLLEANLYLTVCYALYHLIFRRETWYQLNRVYLLLSSLLAFIIPFVQLGFLKTVPQTVQAIVGNPITTTFAIKTAAVQINSRWNINDYSLAAYLLIVFALLINLFIKIAKLIMLSRKHKNRMIDSYKLIETTGQPDAFSFFNYLFINPALASKQTVIHHELIHIRQRHSWDIIYMEILKIINWFNPVVYLLQYSVKELHEFIADSETVKSENDAATYTDFLMNNAYGLTGSTLISTFFNKSLLKNRIIMLNQKKSGKSARLKYLLVIPVFAGLLCLSTLAFSKDYGLINVFSAKVKTISTNAPASSKFGYIIDPESYNRKALDKISAKLYKKGYKMEFNDFFDDDKKPKLEVSIQRLSAAGWASHKASATYRVTDLVKLGYVIFVGFDETKKELYVVSQKKKPVASNATSIVHKNDTANYSNHYTSNGFKYEETGYLLGNRTNFRVVITEKTGEIKSYFKNSANAAQIKELKEKYGYTFPTMQIFNKLPPPPPVPAGPQSPAIDKRPPPPPAPPHNESGELTNTKITDPYDAFYKQLGKYIRYAADARANGNSGVLVAIFTVNKTGKAQEITIVSKLPERMNGEVKRVLQISDASVLSPGTKYAIPIHFLIVDKDNKQVGDENDGKPNLVEIAQNNGATLLKEVVVVSFK